jgi:hypothetical protein
MALTHDQLSAITRRYFLPKLADNIFDSNPTLKKIMDSGAYKSVSGGTKILVPLNYAQAASSGWYSGADTLATADSENITAAEYEWKSLYAGVTISEEDELKNSGDAQVVSLLKSKMQIAEKTLKDALGTGIYSDGTTTKSIVGLRDIVATDQTVGGFSQTDNSWWRGQVDSSTTVTTLSALNSVYENCTIDNEKPGLITCTRAIFTYYYNLLTPAQRFVDESTAKGGFENLMFNGTPVVSDSHVPSSHLFMINMNHLHLFYHPKRNMEFEDFQKPINQQVKVARILWMGALGSSNNRLHGKFSALAA